MAGNDPTRRRAVLGLDAAWTKSEPSGVALVFEVSPGYWNAIAVAPSYSAFLSMAYHAVPPDWSAPVVAGEPDPGALLGAAWRLINPLEEIAITVAVDMPLSKTPIIGRRTADDAVAQRYGAFGCGTHSPSCDRPGKISTDLTNGFAKIGIGLATIGASTLQDSLIEVYPHPALLTLLSRDYRVPHKVSKSKSYWPKAAKPKRVASLLAEFRTILVALNQRIVGIERRFALRETASTLSSLKRYEDALDALVAAWVGIECLEGRAEPFGDKDAAIWCPGEGGRLRHRRTLEWGRRRCSRR